MAWAATKIRVEGRVQGVGFRYWAVDAAQRLGLDGWVRNCSDGSVEILAIGDAEVVGQLTRACQDGPLGAAVASVETTPGEDDGSMGFTEKATV